MKHACAFTLLWFLSGATAVPAETLVPRTILALYDGREEPHIRSSRVHTLAEMPLNHLGLMVDYHDIRQPLPPVEQLTELRGVLTWLANDVMPNPEGYLRWLETLLDSGKRLLVLGTLGAGADESGRLTPTPRLRRFWARLGIDGPGDWAQITYDVDVLNKDLRFVNFERDIGGPLAPYPQMRVIPSRARSHLRVRRDGDPATDADLIVTGPAGGYIAGGYVYYTGPGGNERQWYVNPFELFRHVFATDDLPKPDTTTVSGRRIYYSHIDGDGWRNLSLIKRHRERPTLSSEVVLEEAIKPYPDLPVTVGPVAADLDPEWSGTEETLRVAREVLALPHVEAGSHTYSHPFNWRFFKHYSRKREVYALRLLRRRTDEAADGYAVDAGAAHGEDTERQDPPRAFARQPFDLTHEILGSLRFIGELLPAGKKVMLMQWSGDTHPFEAALAKARQAGVRNINGGDSRFDAEYPSVAWLSPVGRRVGKQWQVYASNSNENTYTALWTDRFFGFQHLATTVNNTEVPIRLKPFNVYYHMYSGERQASLAALLTNLKHARRSEIAPIEASRFAAIGDGFFSTRLVRLGERRWRVEDRDALQTLRFDRAVFQAVDFARSEGVIGQRHYQGSLYVALDERHPAPIVALQPTTEADREPVAGRPYLIHGRWRVYDVVVEPHAVRFQAQGFGAGEMLWQFPRAGRYVVRLTQPGGVHVQTEVHTDAQMRLRFSLGDGAIEPVGITITEAP